MFHLANRQPYQLLFPCGLFYGLIGVILWAFYALGLIEFPLANHIHFMIAGFLFSFSLGFLLTAIPKFTQTNECSNSELFTATFLSLSNLVVLFLPDRPEIKEILSLGIMAFLLYFFLSRFRQRKSSPPLQLLFVPFGILSGVIGSTLLLLNNYNIAGDFSFAAGRLFLYQGTMLFFVLGIGSKIVTVLLGHEQMSFTQKGTNYAPVLQALLFFLGLFVESLGQEVLGRAIRAIVVSWIAIERWKFYKAPKQNGNHAWGLFISIWFLVVGSWVYAFSFQYAAHALHLIFVGGLGTMTLMVATRVSYAHGGYDLMALAKSRFPLVVSITIALASLTRVLAVFLQNYEHHLGYAAFVWTIGVLIWSWFVLPKMLTSLSNEK